MSRRWLIFAIFGLLLHTPVGRADELVLAVTTKLGIDRTVKVTSVYPVASPFLAATNEYGLFLEFPPRTPLSEKYFLVLGSQASKKPRETALVLGIPWPAIKDFALEKDIGHITCADGARFKGFILTAVTGADGSTYPLWQSSRLVVKKYASKLQVKPHRGPVAKCHVRLDNLEHTFTASKIGYRTASRVLSEKFEMKVGDEFVDGVLSDFDKVTVKGTESGPIQITVRAPSGKETTGELRTLDTTGFVFHAANGCAMSVRLRSRSAAAAKSSFQITIENSKAGERLPLELFAPIQKK